MVDGATDVSSS